jgi:hypothetical protein
MALTALLWADVVFSQEGGAGLRVVNTDEFPNDISRDEAGFSLLVDLDPAEHPRLFADCCDLSISVANDIHCYEPDMDIGEDPSMLTVAIEKDTPLTFTTAKTTGDGERCDGAVVDKAGVVTCLDRPVIINYEDRTVSFSDMPRLKPGDTLILFVEDASPFPGRQENTGRNYDCG